MRKAWRKITWTLKLRYKMFIEVISFSKIGKLPQRSNTTSCSIVVCFIGLDEVNFATHILRGRRIKL